MKNVTWGPLDENHPYTDYGIGFELYGKKLGIAGYGAIGREVAKRAIAFGMEILAYDPYMPADVILSLIHIFPGYLLYGMRQLHQRSQRELRK